MFFLSMMKTKEADRRCHRLHASNKNELCCQFILGLAISSGCYVDTSEMSISGKRKRKKIITICVTCNKTKFVMTEDFIDY
jgi:hypothetical protein